MCDTHAYTPRPVCTPRYTKRGIHSCEIHVIDIDGQSFTTNERYQLPRLHRLQNAPMRIARIGADTPSTKTNCMCEERYTCPRSGVYTHMRAMYAYIYIFIKDTTYTYVYRDPSSTIVSSSGGISTSK